MRPNPPRTITVVLAVALLVVGLGLVFYQGPTIDLVRQLPIPREFSRDIISFMAEPIAAWAALAAAPTLLIIGSLLPKI